MSKILIKLFYIITVSLFIQSCSLNNSISNNTDKINNSRYLSVDKNSDIKNASGYISSVDYNKKSLFTHVLLDKNGNNLYFLRSKDIFLDSFDGVFVDITGIIKDNILLVKNLSINKSIDNTDHINKDLNNINSSEFIVFNDSNLFEISYPSLFSVDHKKVFTTIYDDNKNKVIKISVFKSNKNNDFSSNIPKDSVSISINKIPAYKQDTPESLSMYLINNNTLFKFNVYDLYRSSDLILKIISSFSLLDSQNLKKCGGRDNILCDDGFFCEISSLNKGICKKND